jgi:sucrose phosphorylase
LVVDDDPDLSMVVRPRALPLLTEFHAASGDRKVWTTFSADQADLNYHNPDVLLEILDILLTYAEHGAQFIRLDAIAYLWKDFATSCINLPQTHAVIQLLRAVFDEAAPHIRLITETNIPHQDNLSYFGDGKNEAQLIYNFALPPLVLHAFLCGNCRALSEWAGNLEFPSGEATFMNFLASHDGIGLNPVRGILSQKEIDFLVDQTLSHDGLVSYKDNPDGTSSPYEMNINYFDALSDPAADEPEQLQIDRFLAAHAIMLSLRGIPGIYFHSLFGSRSWKAGAELTHQNRQINRQKFKRAELERQLDQGDTFRRTIMTRFIELLERRSASSAFHPQGSQSILDMGSHIFAVSRKSPDGRSGILCLQNITSQVRSSGKYTLQPYQTLWIES